MSGSPFLIGTASNPFTIDFTGRYLYSDAAYSTSIAGAAIQSDGSLIAVPGSPFAVGISDGACAVANPKRGVLYIQGFYSPTAITGYGMDPSTGALTQLPNINTPLPTACSDCLCLKVDPSGRFAYLASRGQPLIYAYTIDQASGALTPVAGSPFSVNIHGFGALAITPDTRFMYAAEVFEDLSFRYNSNLWLLSIDAATGTLTRSSIGLPLSKGPNDTDVMVDSLTIDSSGFLFAANALGFSENLHMFAIDAISGNISPVPTSPFSVIQFPYSVVTTTPRPLSQFAITNVAPTSVGNSSGVTVNIYGSGFLPGLQVTLTSPGNPDLTAQVVAVLSSVFMTVTFDLTGAAPGQYSIMITNPDGTFVTQPGGFNIVAGGTPDIRVDLIGRPVMRGGTQQTYLLTFVNTGCVDGTAATAWIRFPTLLTWDTDLSQQPSAIMQDGADTVLFFDIAGPFPVDESVLLPVRLTAPDDLTYAHMSFTIEAGGGSR